MTMEMIFIFSWTTLLFKKFLWMKTKDFMKKMVNTAVHIQWKIGKWKWKKRKSCWQKTRWTWSSQKSGCLHDQVFSDVYSSSTDLYLHLLSPFMSIPFKTTSLYHLYLHLHPYPSLPMPIYTFPFTFIFPYWPQRYSRFKSHYMYSFCIYKSTEIQFITANISFLSYSLV